MKLPPKARSAQMRCTAALKAHRAELTDPPTSNLGAERQAERAARAMARARVAIGDALRADDRPMPTDKRQR